MRRFIFWFAVITMGIAWIIGPPKPSGAALPLPPGTVPTTIPVAPTWEAMELNGLHAPVSASNVATLDVWAQSEGVVQKNNPLASGNWHTGATVCIAQCVHNSTPIYAYDSMSDGVTANVNFLFGSNYNAVRAAFRADAGMMTIWRTINASKWCSGCQHGLYPIDLYRAAIAQPSVTPVVSETNSPLP